MDNLTLDKALFFNIRQWMQSKYSHNSIKQYSATMKKMFKEHGVLNKDTMRKISTQFKHQNQRATLCLINNYCYENEIDFHIIVPKMKKQPSKIPQTLSAEEIKLMIQAAPKPYDLCIRCLFNMGAGLRVSEIIKLKWNDIRWIDWLKNKESYGVAVIRSGKGSKDRVVNIPKKLMHDLYEFAKEEEVLNEYRIPVGNMIFLFKLSAERDYKKELLSNDIEAWKVEYLRFAYDSFRHNIIKKHCEKALNKKIKIHSLRHSRATYLYEIEHVPIEQIQMLLGHASISTTMIYTKINPMSVFETIKDTKEV